MSVAVGTSGFVAWLYAVIYNMVRNACSKNITIKVFIHMAGLVTIIIGLYFLITTMPSFTSIGGMLLVFIGFFIFLLPLG